MNIPSYVENESAYIDAIGRRIRANAFKTVQKRCAADPAINAIYNHVACKAESGRSPFFTSLQAAVDKYGKLSEKQEAAVAKIIATDAERKAEMQARDAGSQFFGTLGKREVFTLTITGLAVYDDEWGVSYMHFMKDAAGNVAMYKGNQKLGEKGDTIGVKASVKAHYESNGVKTTKLQRPTLEVK